MSDLLSKLRAFYENAETDEYLGDIRDAIEELERLYAERRWIPVSEEVPEQGEPVMAWNSGGWCLKPWACHVICDYRDGEWREVQERDLYPGVTHWMHLPPEPDEWESLPEPPEVK